MHLGAFFLAPLGTYHSRMAGSDLIVSLLVKNDASNIPWLFSLVGWESDDSCLHDILFIGNCILLLAQNVAKLFSTPLEMVIICLVVFLHTPFQEGSCWIVVSIHFIASVLRKFLSSYFSSFFITYNRSWWHLYNMENSPFHNNLLKICMYFLVATCKWQMALLF